MKSNIMAVRVFIPSCRKWLFILGCLFLLSFTTDWVTGTEKPPSTNYCQRLEQEIQGRKHGFLAGNVTYYVGGFHASWKLIEDETIGLTHPFHHDLRGRGVGLLESQVDGTEHTGTGNDYRGWEFYKDTRVLYGSVIVDGTTYKHPKPRSMRWRPDKMICEYELGGVIIREEKFIAANDAAASIITTSKPVKLEFSGHSFYHRNSVSSSASIKLDARNNALVVSEGGMVKSQPDPGGGERVGPCVYTGMTTVLSAPVIWWGRQLPGGMQKASSTTGSPFPAIAKAPLYPGRCTMIPGSPSSLRGKLSGIINRGFPRKRTG